MSPAGSTASRAAAVQWKSLMTQIGVGMGAASFWRGAWYVLDDMVFPDDASASAMTCLATGTLGMAASQHWWAQTTQTPTRALHQSTITLLQRIPRLGALYSMALSCVLVWRGTWVGWDCLYEAYANYGTHTHTNTNTKEKKEVEGNKPEEAKSSRYWMLDALLPVATAAQASPHNSSSNSTTTGHWSPKLPTPRITSSSSSAMMATSHYASPLPHHQHAHHHDFHHHPPQQQQHQQQQHAEPQELQDHPIIKSTDPGHATTSGLASHVLAMAVLASFGVFASVLAPPAGICVLRDAVVLANQSTTTTSVVAKKVISATTTTAPRIPKAAAAAAAQPGTTTYFGRHAPPMTRMAYSTTNTTTTKNVMRRPPTLTTSTSLIQTGKESR